MRLTISAELLSDAHPLPGFPYWKRTAFETVQSFGFDLDANDKPPENYITVPVTRVAIVQALVLTPENGTICVKLNGSNTFWVLNPGGVAVLWLTTLDQGPQSNVLVRNPNPEPVHVRVMAAGIGVHEEAAQPSGGEGFGDQGFGG